MADADNSLAPNYVVDDSACQSVRDRIVAYGKRLCDEQGHYLWGGAGETPNSGGSCKFATVVLDPADPTNANRYPTFNAAELNGCVCTGRYRHPALDAATPKNRVTTASDDQVKTFCDGVRPNDQLTWRTRLTPRLIVGYTGADSEGEPKDYNVPYAKPANPSDKKDNRSLLGKVVWGEGCGDTQHFDCGGFVGYVIKQMTGIPIPNIRHMAQIDPSFVRALKDGDFITPGDILYYKGHVAFSLSGAKLTDTTSGAGKPYTSGVVYELLQAESSVYGLNYGKTKGGHVGCVRLSRHALLGVPVNAPQNN